MIWLVAPFILRRKVVRNLIVLLDFDNQQSHYMTVVACGCFPGVHAQCLQQLSYPARSNAFICLSMLQLHYYHVPGRLEYYLQSVPSPKKLFFHLRFSLCRIHMRHSFSLWTSMRYALAFDLYSQLLHCLHFLLLISLAYFSKT